MFAWHLMTCTTREEYNGNRLVRDSPTQRSDVGFGGSLVIGARDRSEYPSVLCSNPTQIWATCQHQPKLGLTCGAILHPPSPPTEPIINTPQSPPPPPPRGHGITETWPRRGSPGNAYIQLAQWEKRAPQTCDTCTASFTCWRALLTRTTPVSGFDPVILGGEARPLVRCPRGSRAKARERP